MIEDPLYLPKDTPIFMVGDWQNMQVYQTSKEVEKEWNKFGYTITRYKQIPFTRYDFFPYVNKIFDGLKNNQDKITFISHIALWKKIRKMKKGAIIINYDACIMKDIPLTVADKPFLYTHVNRSRPQKANNIKYMYAEHSNSYFLQPRTAHLLYKKLCDVDLRYNVIRSMEEFIFRFINFNGWHVEYEDPSYTFKYVL